MSPSAPSHGRFRFAAFNPAGGVSYHLRARRHAEKLWKPFRGSLGQWFSGWAPREPQLLLVGPSAGYNLQPFLFERFERIVVLEPDPLARWLFRRKLARAPLERRPRLEFVTGDHLLHHPERLVALLASLGPSALLFSNVLGQIVTLLDGLPTTAALDAVRKGVRAACEGRSFASFHDRVSGPVPPSIKGLVESPCRWSDEEVTRQAYEDTGDTAEVVELDDHYTEGFFPEELPHSYLRWDVEPGQYHLIEAVSVVSTLAGATSSSPASTRLPT